MLTKLQVDIDQSINVVKLLCSRWNNCRTGTVLANNELVISESNIVL